MGIPTDITLYTVGTPNGIKASILLEELGLEYKVIEYFKSHTINQSIHQSIKKIKN
jgi:glutathione S-transferase